jgi:hypothetical protein
MPYVGFEPTIPACERAKTVHALDCSAIVTGNKVIKPENGNFYICRKAGTHLASYATYSQKN